MSSHLPVSRQHHGNRYWQRYSSYAFAATDALALLALAELPKAAMALPITFIAQHDRFVPAALMGLQTGQNLLVSPTGQWLGRYVPAAYRSYPFQLLKAEDDQLVMCVDESSGLISDDAVGERFFDDEGQPSEAISEVLSFLQQTHVSKQAAETPTAALQKFDLIRPWPLTIQSESGEQRVEGLFQVDEGALNALPAEALAELRNAGALVVAYCQLLSMQHLGELANLVTARSTAAPTAPDNGANFGSQSETFSFGNLS
ncbi:SapC family protein [Pseudomonas kunmingensis]|uniref:SapC family protein n=1 Tax=Stutzerimonas kunmingensis TaxID=1211807 RepID=UPI000B0B3222|nr:SapC family protein [Stutzerimonas kunmingensis]MBD3873697.1 SapC family protein [Stutzerimonas kunmingensis]